MAGLNQSGDTNKGAIVPDTGLRVFTDIVTCGLAEIGWQSNEKKHQDYLDDQDLLTEYENRLNSIESSISAHRNNITSLQWELEDLEKDRTEAEDFLEDYRQMLAGEGDDDNTLLMQDQLNQENVASAENELAAYRDSSALELDSLIQEGFGQYQSQRNEQAIENLYASATGSVVGAYNSAARRTRSAIIAFVGEDMQFDEAAEGTSIQTRAGEERIGSYAKMLLSTRATRKNNIAKLDSAVKAAQIAYQDFRDEMEAAADDQQTFLDRYDTSREMLLDQIAMERQNISNLQSSALATIENAQTTLDRVNDREQSRGDYFDTEADLTTWDDLDDLKSRYS